MLMKMNNQDLQFRGMKQTMKKAMNNMHVPCEVQEDSRDDGDDMSDQGTYRRACYRTT